MIAQHPDGSIPRARKGGFRAALLAGIALALVAAAAPADPPAQARSQAPDKGQRFVVLDAACLKAPRRKHLTRETFGLPGDLYLDGFNRKLKRTFGLSQPRPREDGSIPGGQVRLELVLGTRGQLCGYRAVGQAGPRLVEAAARHLRSIAPFPPLPESIAANLDAVRFVQSWTYRGKPASSASVEQRLKLQAKGSDQSQSGGARYEVGVPLP